MLIKLLAVLVTSQIPSAVKVIGQDGGYPIAISGTISVAPPAVQAVQGLDGGYPETVNVLGTVGVTGTFWQATQPVSIASMPSTPVTGTFWQATQPVSGTFWQATQPVSGTFWPVTQPVSGTFWQATQPVSLATAPTTPVTGTFWQATQPVSLTTAPTTPVTGTFWQTTQPVSIASMPSTPVTGTFWQVTQPVSVATLPALAAGSAVIGHVIVDTAPTTAVTGTFWQATQPVSLATAPTTPVTGTFWQATQPVSIATAPALVASSAVIGHVINDASSAVIGHVVVDTAPTTAVTGTFWQATQPVSGSLTANIGTAGTLALDATLTGGTQQTKITDGTNVATVKAASTLPAATDKAVVVTLRDSAAVTGTFWQATQPVSIATAPALVASSAVIGHVINDASSAVIGHVIVDTAPTTAVTGTFWQATQPVSGTFFQATQPISAASLPNQHVDSTVATNTAITDNPFLIAAEAQSGQPAAATTGNKRQLVSTLDGELYVRNGGPVPWTCGVNALAASLTQCQAAPAAGLFLYVDGIYVQTTTATSGTYAITCGTGVNCGTTNVALFPISGTANRFNAPINTSQMAAMVFPAPLKCPTAAQELCIIGVATNTISAQIVGHTGP